MEVKLQNPLNWQVYRSFWEKERFLAHLRLAEEVGFEPTNSTYNFESMFSSESFAVCARTKHIFVSFA